jgi:predicted nucleic acid-binding protein
MDVVLIDTNIVLYTLKGQPAIEPYLDYNFAISEISAIELLGVKNIEDSTLKLRKKFIEAIYNYPFNAEIRELTILLKQSYSLKIPDAIIAATAMHYNQTLLTADKDFKKIREITSIIITL